MNKWAEEVNIVFSLVAYPDQTLKFERVVTHAQGFMDALVLPQSRSAIVCALVHATIRARPKPPYSAPSIYP
ncbi:MAG: hypothetical protein JWP72_2367 [Massilia sp.]|nr:hypothetical protein [Massilia sp.]